MTETTPETNTVTPSSASIPTAGNGGVNAASFEDDPVRAKTPPHPQNPAVVDRLLAKRNLEFTDLAHAPFRSSPLAGDRPSVLPDAALRTGSPATSGTRSARASFSHKRSETLPSLSALMAAAAASNTTTPSASPAPQPPPGLGAAMPSAKPRFRPSHGKSASISGVANLFGGQGATAVANAESRPSHLRHVRNRSGGSFGSNAEAAKLIGALGGTASPNWRTDRIQSDRDLLVEAGQRTLDSLGLNEEGGGKERPTRNRSLSMLSAGSPPPPSSVLATGPAPANANVRQFIKTHSRPRAISLGYLNPADLEEGPDLDDMGDFFGFVEPDEQDQQQGDHQTPSRSLWIGNLPSHVSSSDLTHIFNAYGQIESIRILPERECAFINYQTTEEAIKARDDVRGAKIGGNSIKVGFGKADIYGVEQQNNAPTRALWIGNISANTTPQLLHSVFSAFGPIESARVLTHKNCGFVNFDREEDALRAKTVMNGQEIAGAIVRIGFAKVPSKAESTGTGTIQGSASHTPVQHQVNTSFSFPAIRPNSAAPVLGSNLNLTINPNKDLSQGNWRTTAHPNITPVVGSSKEGELYEKDQENASRGDNISAVVGAGAIANDKDEGFDDGPFVTDADVMAFEYSSTIPPLPEVHGHRRVDQSRLREIRKRLDGHSTTKDIENAFSELYDDCVELSYDYIGNTVIQKLMEKGTDHHKLKMIEKIAPHIASIGVHKNGTWAIQKMIDTARTPAQMNLICYHIKKYTPPLMLDQFGNYVVQCCLRLGTQRNQFIFDAMHARCWEIAQGRFGARSMRTCLESQYTTKRQQKHVSIALVENALALSTNPNGSILINWLLDSSAMPGRFRVLAPRLAPHLAQLATHKLANLTVLKIVNQQMEPDARDTLIQAMFFGSDKALEEVLSDQIHGVGVVHKILASPCVSEADKPRIAERVKFILGKLQVNQVQGYRRLMDELSMILMSSSAPAAPPAGVSVAKERSIPSFPSPQANPSQDNAYFGGGMMPLVSPLDASFPMNTMAPPAVNPAAAAVASGMGQQAGLYSMMMNPPAPGMPGMPAPTSPTLTGGPIPPAQPSSSQPSSPGAANPGGFAYPGMYNPLFNPQYALLSMMSMNPQMLQANAAYMMQNPGFAQMLQQQMQQLQQMMQQQQATGGGVMPTMMPGLMMPGADAGVPQPPQPPVDANDQAPSPDKPADAQ